MDSEFIIETPARNRYSMYDFANPTPRDTSVTRIHSFNVGDLPQRSRSMLNLAAPTHFKKRTWVLPESPTVAEKKVQLTKRRTISGTLSPPTPDVPRVERYLEIFKKLKSSYSGFMQALEGFNNSELTPKETLLLEKHAKRLNSRLKKIQDLHELYIHQEYMREGAQNLLNTMERESSKKIRSRIDDVKSNYKKNITRLCAVEDEIDSLAGSIKVQIIGLIGFARLSPGDIYEVQLKHAHGKLTSKCKVVGQGQKWSNPLTTFRVSLMHELQVKVDEVRKMNSNSIGVVGCPIANFLSSESQEFVLPVNSTGTLKLKLAAVWSPFSKKEETAFHGKITIMELPYSRLDSLSDSSLPASPCNTPKNGTLSSMPRLFTESGTLTPMKISVGGTFLSPEASIIKHSKTDTLAMEVFDETSPSDSDSSAIAEESSEPNIASLSIAECEEVNMDSNETTKIPQGVTAESIVCNNNMISLVTGQPEKQNEQPNEQEAGTQPLVKEKPRPVTLGPTFTSGRPKYENVTIFTDKQTENTTTPNTTKKNRPNSLGHSFKVCPSPDYSPHTTPNFGFPVFSSPDYTPVQSPAKESDQKCLEVPTIAIEHEPDETEEFSMDIRSRLQEMLARTESLSQDLERNHEKLSNVLNKLLQLFQKKKQNLARTVSVENALNSIDTAFDFLAEHQTLNQNLEDDEMDGKVDPQRLDKIKIVLHHHLLCCENLLKEEKESKQFSRQIEILDILNEVVRATYDITPKTVCEELKKNIKFGCLWDEICPENQLYCTKDGMLLLLRGVIERMPTCGFYPDEVFETVLHRLQQQQPYSSNVDVVSVFQFTDFFSSDTGVFSCLEEVHKELRTLRALKSNDDLLICSTLQDRKAIPIVSSCLHYLASLLSSKNPTIRKLAGDFLIKLSPDAKNKAINIFVEELSSEDEQTLIAACHALKHLEALTAKNEIGNVWKTSGTEVRKAAFEAMKIVGFPEELQPSTGTQVGYPEACTRL